MLQRLECGLQELLSPWSCPIVNSSKQNEKNNNMSVFDKKEETIES